MSGPERHADGATQVSVVTVTWNSADVLPGMVQSITEAPPDRSWDLVVVDNGSTDATLAGLRSEAPWVRVIANPDNRGLPAANNQGIAATAGEYVLICNPDVRFAAGAIDSLCALLDDHPEAGFAIPRLEYSDGTRQTSAGDLPSLGEALVGRQWQRRSKATEGFWWDGWDHDQLRRIGRGHECAYLVRRAMVDAIGPQDERFFLDWEGIDWTATARAAGWEVWFTPDARVVHLGGASIRQVPVRWVVRSHRGMYRYFAKRRSLVWRPLLAVGFAFRGALKLAGMAARRTTYARGHGRADP